MSTPDEPKAILSLYILSSPPRTDGKKSGRVWRHRQLQTSKIRETMLNTAYLAGKAYETLCPDVGQLISPHLHEWR